MAKGQHIVKTNVKVLQQLFLQIKICESNILFTFGSAAIHVYKTDAFTAYNLLRHNPATITAAVF